MVFTHQVRELKKEISGQLASLKGAMDSARKAKRGRGKLASVPSVHYRSASGRVTKHLPGNYFKVETKNILEQRKELIQKELSKATRANLEKVVQRLSEKEKNPKKEDFVFSSNRGKQLFS